MSSEFVVGQEYHSYRVVREVGRGSNGAVYEAIRGEERYALKLYTGDLASDSRRRFEREGSLLSAFDHPNIVRGFGLFQVSERPFFVMEFVDGENLRDFFERKTRANARPTISTVLAIAAGIADALIYVKADFKIIHRDLKLENALVRFSDGVVKVIDFGLARDLREGTKLPSSWASNAAPRYLSPEKIRDFHASGEPSDVWGLGVIIYWLLTGKFPFSSDHGSGSEHELLEMILRTDPPAPSSQNPDVPPEVDALIGFLLAKEPTLRPSLEQLSWLLKSEPAALPAALVGTWSDRSAQLPRRRFDLAIDRRIDDPAYLFIPEFCASLAQTFRSTRRAAFKRLLDVPCQWGPCFDSKVRKVANVAEVLLAAEDDFLDNGKDVKTVTDAVEWLLRAERNGGYPSLSYGVGGAVTTRCTALATLAHDYVSSLEALDKATREAAALGVDRGLSALLALAGERGWGTWQGSEPRLDPTLWALRALAIRETNAPVVRQRFSELRAMHSIGRPGCFGFRPGTERRMSVTAAFLILVSDLQLAGFVPSDTREIELELVSAFKFLIHGVRGATTVPSEREVFSVEQERLSVVGNVEQLPWLHLTQPLFVEAGAAKPKLHGLTEDTMVWLNCALNLLVRMEGSALLDEPALTESGLALPLFPTACACVALRRVERWLLSLSSASRSPDFVMPFAEGKQQARLR